MWFRILKNWLKWRKDWDSLCNRCGKCCYERSEWAKRLVSVHYDRPCKYLDEETHLCKVYNDRFRKCDRCGKVTLFTALFYPLLPNECAYRKTFRLWDKK